MADTQSFQLKYEGPALADHTIEINDLAPALLGLSELIESGSQILNQDRTAIKLRIKATTPGSFQIAIHATQSIQDTVVDFFSGKQVTALTNLLAILGFAAAAGTSVIELIRRLQGKPPKAVRPLPDKKSVEIELQNGQTLVVQEEVWEICISQKAREAIHKAVKPLENAGIEFMEIIEQERVVSKITKAEAHYFVPMALVEDELQVSERITHVRIVALWFDGEHKWKFSEGESVFSASISDQAFLKKMLMDELAFKPSDLLRVRIRHTQYRTNTGLKSEYEILEVLDHIKGAQQLPLV